MVEGDRESFYEQAVEIIKSEDSTGWQHVVAILLANDLLTRVLCDPGLTLAQSLKVAHTARELAPMTDIALAKWLAETAGSRESISAGDAARLMEILSGISDGCRILPSLMRLLRHPDPYVRSKAVKLVGRSNGSVGWVRGRLAEADPRVRANAIEALWGFDNDEVRELLVAAAGDGNNRVAGNALMALYRLGDCSVIPELLKMAEHTAPPFRSTAAWVMGETGDPRFCEALARMLREPNAAVRARAIKALGRIKNSVGRQRQIPRWLATGLLLEQDAQRSMRRLQLAITSEDGVEHPKISPTQFLLTEDGRQIVNYKVTHRPARGAMSVIFLFPRSGIPGRSAWTRAALRCRAWKPAGDLWAVQSFVQTDSPPPAAPADTFPRYTANLQAITKALTTAGMRADCGELWQCVWSAARPDQPRARGRRHLILFCDAEPRFAPGPDVFAAIAASRILIQVISTVASPGIEEFCRRAGATLRVAESEEVVAEAVAMAYLNLQGRYEIEYQSTDPAAALKVRVNGSDGWAETVIPLPPG